MEKKKNAPNWHEQDPVVDRLVPIKTEIINDIYEFKETRQLVKLVKDASELLLEKGEEAFKDFRMPGNRWRLKDTYIFVLDLQGKMLVHADPNMEGKNQMDLKDISGKPIIRGLIGAASNFPDRPEGWYHYQWPVPSEILPRWKSSFVQLVSTPEGKKYIVGSGMYNDRMEKAFVVDLVNQAVGEINKVGKNSFNLFRDPKGPYIVKNTYVFVDDMNGVEIVNPAFPNIEGRNLMEFKDTNGKYLYKEMTKMMQTHSDAWIDYMWPKPGESISTQKTAYVRSVQVENQTFLVGCGVYLADAPVEILSGTKMKAQDLMEMVRQASGLLQEKGEKAFPEFRNKGSKWFHEDVYLFVFGMNGERIFHAAEPQSEGRNDSELKDVLGRPIVKMILDAAASAHGEGWAHYMYPEPDGIFPVWKSSFIKRVTFPSGKEFMLGCGIYKMKMDKAFIEDIVSRASLLIADQGKNAFTLLRDKLGPFVFMDTYVFVVGTDGTELVNPMQPSLEGKNMLDLKDLKGKFVIRDEISAALSEGSSWLECYWYFPGDNKPVYKQTFVRKVQYKDQTFIVGSGFYGSNSSDFHLGLNQIQKTSWAKLKTDALNVKLSRQIIFGEKGTLSRFSAKAGVSIARHYHASEEYAVLLFGALKFSFDDKDIVLNGGEVLVIPPNVPHSIQVLEDAEFMDFFAPMREDWFRGDDQYLRK